MKIISAPLEKQHKVVSSRFVSLHTCTCHTCIRWLVMRLTTWTSLAHVHCSYVHAHNTVDKPTLLIEWSCLRLHLAIDDQTFMCMCKLLLLTCHLPYGVEVVTCSSWLPGPCHYTLYRIHVHTMPFKLKSHGLESRDFFDTKIGRLGIFFSFAICGHSIDF